MSFWDNETDEKPLLREGEYSALLFNCEMDTSKKGDPVLKLQYKLNNNSRLFQQFNFAPTSAKYILWQMGVLKLNDTVKNKYGKTEDMKTLCKQYYDELTPHVGSTYVKGEVTNEDFNGKMYTRFKLTDITDKVAFETCEIKYVRANTKAEPTYDKTPAAPTFDSEDIIPF